MYVSIWGLLIAVIQYVFCLLVILPYAVLETD
jgi:hypothetical protein